MAARAIPRDVYERALEAYRQHGVNHAHVARLVGVDRATARRWYEKGGRQPWAQAIRAKLEEEGLAARARAAAVLAEEDAKAALLAKLAAEEAITAQGEEQTLRKLGRRAAFEQLKIALERRDLLSRVFDKLEGGLDTMSPRDTIRLLHELRTMLGDALTLAREATELGRLVRGESGSGIGVRVIEPKRDFTLEEVQQQWADYLMVMGVILEEDNGIMPSANVVERVRALAQLCGLLAESADPSGDAPYDPLPHGLPPRLLS